MTTNDLPEPASSIAGNRVVALWTRSAPVRDAVTGVGIVAAWFAVGNLNHVLDVPPPYRLVGFALFCAPVIVVRGLRTRESKLSVLGQLAFSVGAAVGIGMLLARFAPNFTLITGEFEVWEFIKPLILASGVWIFGEGGEEEA